MTNKHIHMTSAVTATKTEYFSWKSNQWIYSQGTLRLNVGNLQFSYFGAVVLFQFVSTGINDNRVAINTFNLRQNYPNPFNPSTKISYTLSYNSTIKLDVYDAIGEKVYELFSGNQEAGEHEINFNASGLASGIYFYRI